MIIRIMKNLKHILILCFIASFALGSCSKMEPLNKATVTEQSDVMSTKMGGAATTGDDDSNGEGITDPDHDEDHDKDNMSTTK